MMNRAFISRVTTSEPWIGALPPGQENLTRRSFATSGTVRLSSGWIFDDRCILLPAEPSRPYALLKPQRSSPGAPSVMAIGSAG